MGDQGAPRTPPPFSSTYLELIRRELHDDLGRAGDITTDAVVPPALQAVGEFAARRGGRLAGLPMALSAITLLDVDEEVSVEVVRGDGADLQPGDTVARVTGPARILLAAERTALNVLSHLSGVATTTQEVVRAVDAYPARVICTRKTLPGLRSLQKYAVRVGGGFNHRFGLDDAVLIKDNHIVAAGGVREAVERARAAIGHLVKIEVEVDTLDQLELALEVGVDAVLRDNMTPDAMATAVQRCRGRATTEASGRVTPETVEEVAATGVDLISLGWLTHSVRALDIGFDLETRLPTA